MHLHGGNIYSASEIYRKKLEDIMDYSANINPLGLPEGIKELIISSIESLVNYPDPDYKELKFNISRYLNIDEEQIIPGNGASEIIHLLFEVLPVKRILIPAPCFSEYAQAANNAGLDTEFFMLQEAKNFKLPVDELLDRVKCGFDALLLCNPNNPTSVLLSVDELYKILHITSTRGIYVILDEAFIELTIGGNSNSMVAYLKEFNNLFIIRALTKIFAIPGLRLGYGLSNIELIKAMWKKKLPWSVNIIACNVAKILNNCREYLEDTNSWLIDEKERFYKELTSINGLKVFEPQTNFILFKIQLPSLRACELKEKMAQNGILIRDASNFIFLNDKFFRAAIKDKESNDKFLKILRLIFPE